MNLLIDVKTGAKFFKVSTVTIYRWVREDQIKKKQGQYLFLDLQKAYDRRRLPKPRLLI